ncbi:MAG: DUF362 domain-containing protein [Candidatus Bathyarchaeota archaeon]
MVSGLTDNNAGEVFLINTADRDFGVRTLLSKINLENMTGRTAAIKANFNSADPFPATTHLDTLKAIVEVLKEKGASDLTLAERSGMGNTRNVLDQLGVFELAEKMGFRVVVLDEEKKENWVKMEKKGTHWLRGFYLAKMVLHSDRVIQTCCLKTHRFGGHFTMSLKNSVGLVAKKVPKCLYNYMMELHGSPYQRLMIAEVNQFYRVDAVVMDAITAFISGGPDRGKMVEPHLMLASRDRVAIDAVGLAILRNSGSTSLRNGKIFELEQIRRAAELGIGVKSASEIKLKPLDEKSQAAARLIQNSLTQE